MGKTKNAAGGEVRLNTDTGFLKILACALMLIDHVGASLLPQYFNLRIVGRLAFPIFAYCLTVGCAYTHSMPKYILRVALLALISQPIYAVALHHTNAAMQTLAAQPFSVVTAGKWYLESWNEPSIMLSILFGLCVLWSLRSKKYIITAGLLLALMAWHGYLDYGWKGIVLMVLFYLFRDKPITSFVWVAGFMIWWGVSAGGTYELFGIKYNVQTFAILALPLIYIPTKTNIKVNKWVFYWFYPAHLAVILLLGKLF